MNAVAAADVPRGTDAYGGLVRDGETPEHALRRIEKSAKYSKIIGTDDGERLLAAATAQVQAEPNGGIPTVSIGGKRVPSRSVAAYYADLPYRVLADGRTLEDAIETGGLKMLPAGGVPG